MFRLDQGSKDDLHITTDENSNLIKNELNINKMGKIEAPEEIFKAVLISTGKYFIKTKRMIKYLF